MKAVFKWLRYEIKFRFILLAVLLIIAVLFVGHLSENFILRQYDAVRLAMFAHRIAGADRVVGTWPDTPVSLTFAGDDAQKIVRAVSSAVSARMPNAEIALQYGERVTFYKGTNVLGQVHMAFSLFILDSSEPPFGDPSKTLDTLVSAPLVKALRESWRTNDEAATVPPNTSSQRRPPLEHYGFIE